MSEWVVGTRQSTCSVGALLPHQWGHLPWTGLACFETIYSLLLVVLVIH